MGTEGPQQFSQLPQDQAVTAVDSLAGPGAMQQQQQPVQRAGLADSLLEVIERRLEIVSLDPVVTYGPPPQNGRNLRSMPRSGHPRIHEFHYFRSCGSRSTRDRQSSRSGRGPWPEGKKYSSLATMQRLRLSRKCTVFLYSSSHVQWTPGHDIFIPDSSGRFGGDSGSSAPGRASACRSTLRRGGFKPSTQSQVAVQVEDLTPGHHLSETSAHDRALSAFTIPIRSHTVMNELPVSTNSKFREVSVTQSALPWDILTKSRLHHPRRSRVRDHQRMQPWARTPT